LGWYGEGGGWYGVKLVEEENYIYTCCAGVVEQRFEKQGYNLIC